MTPRDFETPARDEDLEVLAAAAAGEIPVFFHASATSPSRRTCGAGTPSSSTRCSRAAELLGFGGEVGSLDAGKRADVLVTDGSPLQQLTRIETMFIGGIEVDPRDNDHTRAYERFRERR